MLYKMFLTDALTFLVKLLKGSLRCLGVGGEYSELWRKCAKVWVRDVSAIKHHCLCSRLYWSKLECSLPKHSSVYTIIYIYTHTHIRCIHMCIYWHVFANVSFRIGPCACSGNKQFCIHILQSFQFKLFSMCAHTHTHIVFPRISTLSICSELYSDMS